MISISRHNLPPWLRRTLAISEKETFHILRDLRALAVSFLLPVMLLVLFGYGVSFDLDRAPLTLVDLDQSPASRKIAQDLTANGEFIIAETLTNAALVASSFRNSKTLGAIIIPNQFGEKITRGENPQLQFLVDGSSGTIAGTLLGSMADFTQYESSEIAKIKSPSAQTSALKTEITMQYNPALRSAIFFVPGLVAYILAIVAVLLTSLTVAKEWERGNMEQLFATPVNLFEVVIGKLLPYLAIGCLQALLVLAIGTGVFNVPIVGNPALLAISVLLFMFGMLGQGLFISVITRNQMLAILAASISAILPALLLSGFLYPITNMPLVLQGLSLVFPARYMIAILRGVLLKGSTFVDLWPQFLGLASFSIVIVAATRARFVRRIA